jgi:hypothetical protein
VSAVREALHLEIRGNVSRNTLANANATRDLRIDPKAHKRLVFLANQFALHALSIVDLYRCRWQVELGTLLILDIGVAAASLLLKQHKNFPIILNDEKRLVRRTRCDRCGVHPHYGSSADHSLPPVNSACPLNAGACYRPR